MNHEITVVRGDDPNQRMILTHDIVVPGVEGGEAAVAVDCFSRVLDAGNLPKVKAIVYDGALRGTHVEQLYRYCLPVLANMTNSAGRGRNEREYPFPVTIIREDGTKDVINAIDPKTGRFSGPHVWFIEGGMHSW